MSFSSLQDGQNLYPGLAENLSLLLIPELTALFPIAIFVLDKNETHFSIPKEVKFCFNHSSSELFHLFNLSVTSYITQKLDK